MLDKLIFRIIVIFVTFCLGFLMGGLFIVFPFIEKAFWEAKITDYFSLIFTLLVGGGAAYFISHSIEKNNHDAAVIDTLVDKVESELNILEKNLTSFIEKKSLRAYSLNKNDLSQITLSFKIISSILTVIETAVKNKDSRTRELYNALKQSITDDNFTLKPHPFSEIQQKKIQDLFLRFKIQLYNIKISSFK